MTLRSLRNYSKEIFEEKLHEVDWQDVLDSNSVHEAFYHFNSKLMVVIDNIAPLKYIRIKQRTAPWVTGEILDLIYERYRAFQNSERLKTPVGT